ncbi:MAG: ATP phosphoribosyltransferase regulatory subunit [Clostridiales Family XIII bacterium]|jgi:ATP phosphoribosyltransferase regulatory subunit|nr:ATP phosphoribosyltransferase regulatory subunit [Clostridiales Family XIII bacterium]
MTRYDKLTPDGTSDRLFEACAAEKEVVSKLSAVFERAGYRQVRTPGLEFLSVFASNAEYFPQEEMYKLSDNKGRLIAVRPDSTIPIARMTATKLRGAALPIRLYYAQSVFRRQPEHRGRNSEIMQMGVELIGEAGFSSDVDMIELAIRSLAEGCAGRFRIEIGHVGLYKALMDRLGASEEERDRIHRYVTAKNYAALDDVLDGVSDRETAALIRRLPGLFGGGEALDEAAAMFDGAGAELSSMLAYLKQVFDELARRGFAEKVMIDLGLVNQAEYYSSLVFKGYGESAGEPLLSGGRYDGLFADFGEDLPATGFGINVDLLTEAVQGESLASSAASARPLRIALTKGRLEEDFMALMAAAGYDMAPLRDKGRKLLIGIPGTGIEIFLAKAPDVITYVEQGVCEIGVVGKDTILEQGGTYYEIMDLSIGKCRFALAAPRDGAVAAGAAPAAVASKYPNYAGRYFERRGLDVRIIRIEGSVEIAPLLGLADSIVDIVETGTTLKENGLDVVEVIREISARLIINVTGMKLRKREIDELTGKLAGVLPGNE